MIYRAKFNLHIKPTILISIGNTGALIQVDLEPRSTIRRDKNANIFKLVDLRLAADIMDECGLKAPKRSRSIPKNARFFFTELGYKKVGLEIEKVVRQRDFDKIFGEGNIIGLFVNSIALRWEKRKNPKKSDIVYSDQYQVAVLPNRKHKKLREDLKSQSNHFYT